MIRVGSLLDFETLALAENIVPHEPDEVKQMSEESEAVQEVVAWVGVEREGAQILETLESRRRLCWERAA